MVVFGLKAEAKPATNGAAPQLIHIIFGLRRLYSTSLRVLPSIHDSREVSRPNTLYRC